MKDPIAAALEKARNVSIRATAKDDSWQPSRCAAYSCKEITQRGKGLGLSDLYCRRHVEFVSRHGSSWRKTFTSKDLAPYRKAAGMWLDARSSDGFIKQGLREITQSMEGAGPVIPITMLARATPQERSKAAWARLRERGVKASVILRDCLAVLALVGDELASSPRDPEFRNVQLAKVIYRKASGWTHTRVVETGGPGITVHRRTFNMEPRGRMLRYLGAELFKVCDRMIGRDELLALVKASRGVVQK